MNFDVLGSSDSLSAGSSTVGSQAVIKRPALHTSGRGIEAITTPPREENQKETLLQRESFIWRCIIEYQ